MQPHIEAVTFGGSARSGTEAIRSADPTAVVEADPSARSVVVAAESPRMVIEDALAQTRHPALTPTAA